MEIFSELIEAYPLLAPCKDDILRAFDVLKSVYERGGKVLLCGSGGSAADCEHIVGELMKEFRLKRPIPYDIRTRLTEVGAGDVADNLQGALPALSLVSQTAIITAFSNDVGYNYAFAQQVYGYGKKGDALIAISTSGNATSVLNACKVANAMGLYAVGLTGASGGALKSLCHICVAVPSEDTAAIQEMHVPVYHALCAALESGLRSVWERKRN